jgi:hypothetical protein
LCRGKRGRLPYERKRDFLLANEPMPAQDKHLRGQASEVPLFWEERSMRAALVVVLSALAVVAVPVSQADAPKGQEFIGKDLKGWEGLNEYWTFKDGELVGSTEPKGITFNTFLCSKKKYKDFELSFKVRLKNGAGNSGVQIRSEVVETKRFAVRGPQADIGAGYWGSLYGERLPGGMMKAAPKEAQKKVKAKDFNDYYIKVVGKRVTIKLNGVTTVDQEFPVMKDEGIIAWQLHGGGPMVVTFKDIVFKEIKEAPKKE